MGAVFTKKHDEAGSSVPPSVDLTLAVLNKDTAQIASILSSLPPDQVDSAIMDRPGNCGDLNPRYRVLETTSRHAKDNSPILVAIRMGDPQVLAALFTKASRPSWPNLTDILFFEPGFKESHVLDVIRTFYGAQSFAELAQNEEVVYRLVGMGRLGALKEILKCNPNLTVDAGNHGFLTRLIDDAWHNFMLFASSDGKSFSNGLHTRIENCIEAVLAYAPDLLTTSNSPLSYAFHVAIQNGGNFQEFKLRLDLCNVHGSDQSGALVGPTEKDNVRKQLNAISDEALRSAVIMRFFENN